MCFSGLSSAACPAACSLHRSGRVHCAGPAFLPPTPPTKAAKERANAPRHNPMNGEQGMRKMMIAAAAIAATTAPALAQVNTSGGLVNVSVQNVDILKNFLNNDQIALLNGVQVPVTVAVPIGV